MLWGKDHAELGSVGRERVGGAALALSRGLRAKAYAYTDPNEDAVAAVVGRRSTLIVVADGHNGLVSAQVAVETVLEWAGDDPPAPDVSADDLVELFWAANQAILTETLRPGSEAPESRTTLALALVSPGTVQWASFGDSAVFAVTPAAGVLLNRPRLRFVGYPMPQRALASMLDHGTTELAGGEWVLVTSDGFSDFARPFPTAVFTDDADPGALAADLVRSAFDGGAGDNVAVGVVRP